MGNEKKPMQPQLRRFLYQKAARNRVPISGTFELTPRCNMNCRMCYIRMSEEEMRDRGREYTAQEWISMGQICREQGMLFLLLTGGEPFLRTDFREIYTELSRMGFVISINSNGTMIRPETVAWLKEIPPSRINITLYGASNETYARLCRNPHGFEQAVRAIDLLRDAGIYVNINASFTPYNVDDMEAIYAFARERDLTVTATSYMFPPMRSAREGVLDKTVRFTGREAGTALFYSKKCWLEQEEFERFLQRTERGLKPEEEEECSRTPDEHMGCMAGKSSFWITWDGRMTPCGMMNQPVTRPFEGDFVSSWKKICEETERILLPAECGNCRKRFACMVCGALTIAEGQGESTKRPEYLCEMTEAYLELCRQESGSVPLTRRNERENEYE